MQESPANGGPSHGDDLVSVVIPVFNDESNVAAAISSALGQTYPNVEVVVVDDGSTDHTPAVLDGFSHRITRVSQPNGGLSAARNAGIAAAHGTWISLCDADDVLLPHHVDAAMQVGLRSPSRSLVTSDAFTVTARGLSPRRRVLPRGSVPAADQREAILDANVVSIFSTFPRVMIDELGGFDVRLRRCEDWHLWARAVLAGWTVVFQTHPSALYYLRGSSLSADAEAMHAAEDQALMLLAELPDGLTADERTKINDRVAKGSKARWRAAADDALRRGRPNEASEMYLKAAEAVGGGRRERVLAKAVRRPLLARRLAVRHAERERDRERIAPRRVPPG